MSDPKLSLGKIHRITSVVAVGSNITVRVKLRDKKLNSEHHDFWDIPQAVSWIVAYLDGLEENQIDPRLNNFTAKARKLNENRCSVNATFWIKTGIIRLLIPVLIDDPNVL